MAAVRLPRRSMRSRRSRLSILRQSAIKFSRIHSGRNGWKAAVRRLSSQSMNIRVALGLVLALGIAFAGGSQWQAWRTRAALKAQPCHVTTWDPNRGQFVGTALPVRFCVKLSQPQTISGTWVDAPYEGQFTPDRPANLPTDLDLSADWPSRARIYWLAGLRGPPPAQRFSGRRFHVSLVGRVGNRGCCWTDTSQNTIVVDEVLSAELMPNR